ncbi:MAG: DNA polymerase III subunit delta' [Bacilli bacterium]|nr:DNA polymerase III subunit delta' [Bacilli bacterium]
MSLHDYINIQPKVIRMLINSYQKNRLAHAYLFEGEKGTKKKEIALEFAKLLYCEDQGNVCDHCLNCQRIMHQNHPNVLLIEPDENILRKEQVLFLQQEYSKTNLEPGPKVYIINEIEKMSTQAANSILKFIEEPMPDTYTILITDNIHQILPTIISRCQVLNFQPIPKADIINYLYKHEVKPLIASICANLTNDLDMALNIAREERIIDIIKFVQELGQAYLTKEKNLLVLLENNKIDLYKDKKVVEYFLDIFLMYMRDIEKLKIGNQDTVFKNDLALMLQNLHNISTEDLIHNLKEILSAKINLNYNANLMLLIDNLFLNLK